MAFVIFSRSRGIQLPEGNLNDFADVETVHGLCNSKNGLVNRAIAEVGVEPYAGTVQFIHQLRREGFKIAVVTFEPNCSAVLKAAKLDDVFKVRVDGNTIEAERLARQTGTGYILDGCETSDPSRHGRLSSRTPSRGWRPAQVETSGW